MPQCPHCHEYYLGNSDVCYKCNYDFKLKRVVTQQEACANQVQRETELSRKLKEDEIKQIALESFKNEQLRKNAMFEYCVDIISDLDSGTANYTDMVNSLNSHAKDGWRLSKAFTNEIGRTSSIIGFSGIAGGINATIDSTVLIYERCIKAEIL